MRNNDLYFFVLLVAVTSTVAAIGQIWAIRRYLIRRQIWLIGTPLLATVGSALAYQVSLAIASNVSSVVILIAILLLFTTVAAGVGWVQSFSFHAAREVRGPWSITVALAWPAATSLALLVLSLFGFTVSDLQGGVIFALCSALIYTAITGPVLLWALGRRIYFRPRVRPYWHPGWLLSANYRGARGWALWIGWTLTAMVAQGVAWAVGNSLIIEAWYTPFVPGFIAGLTAGIGQLLIVQRYVRLRARWFLATAGGWFAGGSISLYSYLTFSAPSSRVLLLWVGIIGFITGIAGGLTQSPLLVRDARRRLLWISASGIGLCIGMILGLFVGLSSSPRPWLNGGLLGIITGLLYGLATGPLLLWFFRAMDSEAQERRQDPSPSSPILEK